VIERIESILRAEPTLKAEAVASMVGVTRTRLGWRVTKERGVNFSALREMIQEELGMPDPTLPKHWHEAYQAGWKSDDFDQCPYEPKSEIMLFHAWKAGRNEKGMHND
jgi:hypothetical protein